jgi:hypothetical protein
MAVLHMEVIINSERHKLLKREENVGLFSFSLPGHCVP